MRIVIVDDEPLARERLRRLLADFPGYEVIGEADNGDAALELIERERPDVVLLDIRMGGRDGLQVARRLSQQSLPPAVIFTTAHAEHALSAFDASAQGYLMKPVRREKLAEALQRTRRPSRALNMDNLSGAGRPQRQFVVATTREGIRRIPAEDVIFFLADQKYTTVYHLHGEVLIEESLNKLEEDFSAWFLRVHRKALVATRFITGLERGRQDDEEIHWLRMRHVATLIPVSRRRLAEVRRALIDKAADA